MAWIFGWLAGTGLPPTATYIILAVIIVPPLRTLGVDPWVAHCFAFLIAIWGELSPPTSLTAAVSARIADASFMRTMFEALKICMPITFMSFAIFVRSGMVATPGWDQIVETLLVAIGTCGITLATFGHFVTGRPLDWALRVLLAIPALVVMFHPRFGYAVGAAVLVAVLLPLGVLRHRVVAGAMAPASMAALRETA
jgi:TRAP-type uncharacterized transport system fused permease subunit